MYSIPTNLQNGRQLPKKYVEICNFVPSPPKYKVVTFSLDRLYNHWRLVHAYYVSLLAEDPSRFQSFMKTRERARRSEMGVEDGKLVPTMMVFHNGSEKARQAGAMPAPALRKFVEHALGPR